MKITLNLATRPFVDLGPLLRQLRIGMGTAAVLSLLFALGLHLVHDSAERARAREHALDGQIARVTQERQGYKSLMQRPENARLVAETTALNELFDEKAFSWTLSLENLERVMPAGVHVQTLEPRREKDGRISVHLRVGGPRDRVEELERGLERSERFRNPRIVGESADQTTGFNQKQEPVSPQNKFTFDIFADYNPPAPGERQTEPEKQKAETAGKKAAPPATTRPITAYNAAGKPEAGIVEARPGTKHGAKAHAGGAR